MCRSKEIRKALALAEAAGLAVVSTTSGHRWGYVHCNCGAHINIYSTGATPRTAQSSSGDS